ncbi:hypothetical protein AB0E77_14370 [Streptomyces sp. NPDC032940]|uniref:hypothetical protein n=1 Tax=Streptomyces sp. NPDC032940 TaxID=3155366 RepID=UPI0033D8F144
MRPPRPPSLGETGRPSSDRGGSAKESVTFTLVIAVIPVNTIAVVIGGLTPGWSYETRA